MVTRVKILKYLIKLNDFYLYLEVEIFFNVDENDCGFFV